MSDRDARRLLNDRLDWNLFLESELSIQGDTDFEPFIQEHARLLQVGQDAAAARAVLADAG